MSGLGDKDDSRKIKLLTDISVGREGSKEAEVCKAGTEVTLPKAQAERHIRLGHAEKA